jgi:hypothetical protein
MVSVLALVSSDVKESMTIRSEVAIARELRSPERGPGVIKFIPPPRLGD